MSDKKISVSAITVACKSWKGDYVNKNKFEALWRRKIVSVQGNFVQGWPPDKIRDWSKIKDRATIFGQKAVVVDICPR